MSPTTGLILAGGASRRMGVDKRTVPIEGEPMLRRVVSVVSAATDELIVAVSPAHPLPEGLLADVAARVVIDRYRDAGPLAGLEAGLRAAQHEVVVAVAADMPWIDGTLLRRLVVELAQSEVDVVAVATQRGPEPLLAAWRREVALTAATRLLDAGERRLRALLEALRAGAIADPTGRSALNVNEPTDLVGVDQTPPRVESEAVPET